MGRPVRERTRSCANHPFVISDASQALWLQSSPRSRLRNRDVSQLRICPWKVETAQSFMLESSSTFSKLTFGGIGAISWLGLRSDFLHSPQKAFGLWEGWPACPPVATRPQM